MTLRIRKEVSIYEREGDRKRERERLSEGGRELRPGQGDSERGRSGKASRRIKAEIRRSFITTQVTPQGRHR